MPETHDILMITYNRFYYTGLALKTLLETCNPSMRVWIWHNGGHPDTLALVREMANHPRVHTVHISKDNLKLHDPTNWFLAHATGDYLSKVDDDCLMTPGWSEKLIQAHRDIPQLGVIGCWRFYDEDFRPELANRKICTFNNHQVLLNCWVQGSGYVLKRACVEQVGLMGPRETFTDYCIRIVDHGWINGWYFPFIHEEHMDDPRSALTVFKNDAEFQRHRPLSAARYKALTLEEWSGRIRWIARHVQEAPPDPKYYLGWRKKLNGLERRLRDAIGLKEPWQNSHSKT